MLSVWPCLGKSPVSTHWEWSPLIHDAYERNRHLFQPSKISFFAWLFDLRKKEMPVSISGLLAIHVRRGDFQDHCVHLATWSSDWQVFNTFAAFSDKLDKPSDEEERKSLYMRRCYPSIEEIVEKVRKVRMEAANPLRYLYIMTNGAVPWVKELKSAIIQDMDWDHVGSSRDLDLSWQQKFVSQALDMSVAQRAQVFIGNGVRVTSSDRDIVLTGDDKWSSLTSNVVMLRMAQGSEPDTNRFW
jgi:hypothetical protein